MTRINRIGGPRMPAPISRQPEQEPAFLKEQMRQRSELEDQNEQSKKQKQPTPEEQAQRKAEKVMDGAVRGVSVKVNDPAATPVISIADLFHRAKSAGLRQDEINRIQSYLKQLNAQDRTQQLRFLQDHVLRAKNMNQCFRIYSEITGIAAARPARLNPLAIRAIVISVAERITGKRQIPSSICTRNEALETAEILTELPEIDHARICTLLVHAGEKGGEKNRDADPDTERALILKSLGLRSRLYKEADSLTRMRKIAQVAMKPTLEIEQFAMRIRGLAGSDLLDYARTTMPLQGANTPHIYSGGAGKSPQQFLRDGFYNADGSFRNELVGLCAISAAEQMSHDGVQASLIKQLVHQLTHVAHEYEDRYSDSLGYKLDPAALTVTAMIMESEVVSESPVLWELMDTAGQWTRDLKGLAGLILHLDAIADLL